MNFLIIGADNQIRIGHDLPVSTFSKFSKALTAAKMNINNERCAVYLEDARRGYKIDGDCKILPSGNHGVFLLPKKDTMIEFTRPDGDTWYAHNDPVKNEIVVKKQPIARLHLSEPAINWLLNLGESNRAMCWHLFKVKNQYQDVDVKNHPRNPVDFFRCRLFVEATNCRNRIQKMASVSPTWAMYVSHWDELCELMDAEVNWMKGDTTGNAVNTYAVMQAMQDIAFGRGEERLHIEARKNIDLDNINACVAKIKALVKYGVNVDARNESDDTTLMRALLQFDWACQASKPHHAVIIKTLVECGADIHARSPNTPGGVTAIEYAKSLPDADLIAAAFDEVQKNPEKTDKPADTLRRPRIKR